MWCGWSTSQTRNTLSRLFERPVFGRNVARLLSALYRVPVLILLVRSPIVLALFLVSLLLFRLGRFRHNTLYTPRCRHAPHVCPGSHQKARNGTRQSTSAMLGG